MTTAHAASTAHDPVCTSLAAFNEPIMMSARAAAGRPLAIVCIASGILLSGTTMPPTTIEKIPDSVLVGLMQHSTGWMLPPWNGDLELRKEWLKRMKDGREQLIIMDHYLEQADIRAAPPVPVFFSKIMQTNLKAAYDHAAGYDVEEIGRAHV